MPDEKSGLERIRGELSELGCSIWVLAAILLLSSCSIEGKIEDNTRAVESQTEVLEELSGIMDEDGTAPTMVP